MRDQAGDIAVVFGYQNLQGECRVRLQVDFFPVYSRRAVNGGGSGRNSQRAVTIRRIIVIGWQRRGVNVERRTGEYGSNTARFWRKPTPSRLVPLVPKAWQSDCERRGGSEGRLSRLRGRE